MAPIATLRRGNSDMRVSGLSSLHPGAIPIPYSPTLSVQRPSSPSLSFRLSPPASSIDKSCTPSRAPLADHGRFDHLSNGQIRGLRKRRVRGRVESREVSVTRSASIEDEESRRILTGYGASDASVTVSGKRARPPAGVAELPDGPAINQDKRFRADALRLAFAADTEVVKEHAQWRNP